MMGFQTKLRVYAYDNVNSDRDLSVIEAMYVKFVVKMMKNILGFFTIFSALVYFITLNMIMKYVILENLSKNFIFKSFISTIIYISIYFSIIFIIDYLNRKVNREFIKRNLKIINMGRDFIRVYVVFTINFVLFLYNRNDYSFNSIFMITLHTYIFTMNFTILKSLYMMFINLIIFNPINFIIKSIMARIDPNMEICIIMKK